MSHALYASLLALGLFLTMLLCLAIGRWFGLRRSSADAGGGTEGVAAVDGAVFALLGLLIAFTFSGASSRFDARRHLIVEETNDIGTAWLRLGLVPAEFQPDLRDAFRRYLDTRLAVYAAMPDLAAAKGHLAEAQAIQGEIWRQALTASLAPGAPPAAPILLLPALNAMFDITTTRTMASMMHPPDVVFAMLFGLALAASLLAGYGMTGNPVRSWFHMTCFALVMAVAVYVILDYEYPRKGLIRVDDFDQALIDLRATMNEPDGG